MKVQKKKQKAIRGQLKYLENTGGVDTAGYEKLQSELIKTENKAVFLRNSLEEINKLKYTQAAAGITKIGNGLTKAGQAARGLSIAAAAVTGLFAIGKATAVAGAELDDFAQRSQISAEAAQEWQYVAMQTGVEVEQLSKAIIKSRAAYTDLTVGEVNAYSEAMANLGIVAGQFDSTEEMFNETIKRLSAIEDETLQVSIANEIFGDKIANNLIPLLNAGDEALAQFKDEFAGFDSLTNEQVGCISKNG